MVHGLELLQRDLTCLPHASVSIAEGFPHAIFVFPNVLFGVEYFVPCFFQYLVFVQWFVQV